MAVPVSTLENFKIETQFGDGYVVHTTYKWEFSTRGRGQSSKWEEVGLIGSGAFGSVWLEKEQKGGLLRAVKRLPRASLIKTGFSQELLALITVGDASAPRMFLLVLPHYWTNRMLAQTPFCRIHGLVRK